MTDETIFATALEKADPAERAAYLDDVCAGDAERRQRLEGLLAAAARADRFLERPAVAASGPDSDETCRLGAEGAAPAEDEDDAIGFLVPSSRPDSLGRLGHYEVLEVLGKGGFGVVFRAFDETLQRMVAIKVLAPGLASTSPPRKRFLREARSSAKVRHENVVQVYAVEELPLPYLVMEFIPGETLQQRLDRTGPLETAEVVRIGRQLAEGLAAAHAQGLIHRDIKPGNILLEAGPHPHVKLTDFGLARAADDASLTQSGTIAGTPMFMAPEQAHGDALDHRADLFSLGSVLYTMASGRPPFRANSTLAVLKRVAEDTPRPIREIIPEVPQWLCDLIARLHAKKPTDRLATAQEVADLLAAPVVAAVDLPNPSPTVRPRGRARRWAAAAVVLLVLLVGLGVTEATGVTNARSTVIRLFAPEGTLEIQVDDPAVSVQIDGGDVVITGAGVKELRLKTGRYTVETLKGGAVVRRELVSVTRDGRNVVRVTQESAPPEPKDDTTAAWERSVAALPADEQVKAVGARLKQLNPGFDGKVEAEFEGDAVIGLKFATDRVRDIAPVRALTRLRSLTCRAYAEPRGGPLVDLAPLRGLRLTHLDCVNNQVADLAPLAEMKLEYLNCDATRVIDLSPLRRVPLKELSCAFSKVANLAPLRDMPLTSLSVGFSEVSDLTPLKGLPLTNLGCGNTKVTDLAPLKGMALRSLHFGNTGVTDLSPLKGMNPVGLFFDSTRVTDLSPLKGMSLQELYIGPLATDLSPIADMPLIRFHHAGFEPQRDAKVLRAIKTLTTINNLPAAEFWKGVDEKSRK